MLRVYNSIDLFAGIGGIRLGFEKAFGKNIKTVFVSEIDLNAQKTYSENFEDSFHIEGDIKQISETDIPEFDICLAGFPCQAFSLAGARKGFDDDYKGLSRGTLFFEVIRICSQHKPKVIFCENVKGLTIHDRGKTFEVIKGTLEEIGYTVYTKILNSKDFGVPQNRERIYIVAFRNDIDSSSFHFPEPTDQTKTLYDIIEKKAVSVKYYLSDTYLNTLIKHRERHEKKGNGFGYEIKDLNGIASAIVCGGMGRERNLIVDKRLTDFTPITHIKGNVNREGVRKMTPREWARLQGFPEKYKLSLADVHLYKQFGNSVTVPVIEAIANKIKEVLELSQKEEKEQQKTELLTANKGEWAEIYTFFSLLAEGKIYCADENLNKLKNIYFPIIKIIREEIKGQIYDYEVGDKITICLNNDFKKEIDIKVFEEQAKYLLDMIHNSKGRSFSVKETNDFMTSIYVNRVKEPGTRKADILMHIQDIYTGIVSEAGFSIKSKFTSESTLLNSSEATNFIYKIEGFDDKKMNMANAIETESKVIDRIKYISENSDSVSFVSTFRPIASKNLMMVDSLMPEIIGQVVYYYYFSGIKTCVDLVEQLEKEDPLGYKHDNIYLYKMKKMLSTYALGMTLGKKWNGKEEANGGYLVVKESGEVVAYHIYSRDLFESYLLKKTKLEHGGTTKHKYGSVYKENNKYFIRLNLAIRFI